MIAKSCKVGVSTVSTALNHPQKIGVYTRERIIRTARELGYFSRGKEVSVKKIIIVADNYKDYFFGEYYQDVIFGIQNTLSQLMIPTLVLSNLDVDYSRIYDYDGIVFVGRTPPSFIQFVQKYKIPFVLAGHPYYDNHFPCVYQDTQSGVLELMSFTINCRHERIALLTGEVEEKDYAWNLFLSSYKWALKRNNIEFDDQDIYQSSYHQVEKTEIAFNQILSSKKRYSTIFCSSDLIACFAMMAAKKYEISIPKDISISGFDGIKFPRHLSPFQSSLTTMACDRERIGQEAVKGLVKLINKDSFSGKVIPMIPQIRESVRRV